MKRSNIYYVIILFLVVIRLEAQDFQITTSTYIGSSEISEEINGVDVAPDGSIVVVGILPESYNPDGLTSTNLLGGGTGVIIRYAMDGKSVLSVTRIKDSVFDVEVGEQGQIAVCGNFGVAVLNAEANDFLWKDTTIKTGTPEAHTTNFYQEFADAAVKPRYVRSLSRVSIGKDGTVATMQVPVKYWYVDPPECYVYVYNSEGDRLYDFLSNDEYPMDIAVDGNNQLVIFGGWNAEHAPHGGIEDHPIHVPFMRAYNYSGNLQWKNYGWSAEACYDQNHFADSRVQVMTIGEDGYLYMGGYIHGGDHLWKLGPKDITDRPDVTCNTGDVYSQAINMGAGMDHAYFARFDPVNGDILKGQALLSRETEDNSLVKPRQIQIKGIDADEDGIVYMSGYTQDYIYNRSNKSINGMTVGAMTSQTPYAEPFFMEMNQDWSARNVWTVFSKNNCEGAAWGMAYRNGIKALVGEVFTGEIITTNDAPQPAAAGVHDGFLVTWGNYNEPIGVNSSIQPTKNQFVIMPNPASDYIKFPDDFNKGQLSVLNNTGQLVIDKQISGSQRIDISSLSPGLYFVMLRLEGSIQSASFVKE